jgi:exonuclease VII large subunit
MRRIEASFADVGRRQVEHLQRVISRDAERLAEAAAQQFDGTLRSTREETAARLARELDRAVDTFVRQADALFAERLSSTGDNAQQRIEARLRQAQSAFERQQEELAESFTRRIADADVELRRTLGSLVAEAEAERIALEARLMELARRIDDVHAGLRRG